MKTLVLGVSLALLGVSPVHGDAPSHAEPPVIELVTMGPGESLFEAFGHAALCVRYVDDSQSACFNYGVTEFERPGALVWNFIRGTQVFWSEASNYAATIEAYRELDRDMWRQAIPATPAQARAIADRLWREADRDHGEYIYDHIANNCATRLRDVLDDELGGPLRAAKGTPTSITTRAVAARGFAGAPAVLALTDFVLGRPMERSLDRWEAMFLPEVLRTEVTQRMSSPAEVIATRQGPAYPTEPSPWGRVGAIVIALICALPMFIKRRLPVLAALPLVVMGLVIWGLVAISPIGFVRWNEALLVFVPIDALLTMLPVEKRRRYARARVIGLLLVTMASVIGLLRQPLWLPIATALIPLLAFSEFWPRGPGRPTDADTGSS